MEILERRALLAADFPIDLANPDTNRDGKTTASDAILIANYLNGDRVYDVTSPEVMAGMVRLDANQDSLVNGDDFFTVLGRIGIPSVSTQDDAETGQPFVGIQAEGEDDEEFLNEVSLYALVPFLGINPREQIQAPASQDGIARFRVERSYGSMDEPLTVKYNVNAPQEEGVATPGIDYDALTGTIVIPAGEYSADIFINVINDSKVEDSEIVSLTLVEDAAYTLNYASTADHLYIDDNDYWAWDSSLNPGANYHITDDQSPVAGYSTGHLEVNGWASAYYSGDEVVTNVAIDADFTYLGYLGWQYHREQSDGGKVKFTFDEDGKIHRSFLGFDFQEKTDNELTIGISYVADIQDTSDSLRWVKVTPQAAWTVNGTVGFTVSTPEILGAQIQYSNEPGGYSDGDPTTTYSFYLKVFEESDPNQGWL